MTISTFRPSGYNFEFDGQTFEFDFLGKEVINMTSGETVTYNGSLFTFYLKELLDAAVRSPNEQEHHIAFDYFGNVGRTDHSVAIRDLRDLLAPLIRPNARMKLLPRGVKSDRGTKFRIAAKNVTRTSLDGATSLLARGNDPMQNYRKLNDARARGEAEIVQLMHRLTRIFSVDLEDFFFRTERGTFLPFHHMKEATYGRPRWPLDIISDHQATPGKDRGASSLVHQRWLEGARLYNGHIYKLMQALPEKWVLGRTRYFEVLNNCDILRDRILAEWGKVCDDPSSAVQDRALKNSLFVQEWLENVRAIRRGDFSTFAAGIAMNMPIFAMNDGDIILLMGKGAVEKATGGGKLHVCPAGMLEFRKNARDTCLSFADFRTYLVKELYEEGFKDPRMTDEITENILQGNLPLMNADNKSSLPDDDDFGDWIKPQGLEEHFNKTERWMQQEGESWASTLQLSKQARSITEKSKTYQIVDAFRLRPEIIVPHFAQDLPELFLGWEFKGYTADHMSIPTMEALENIVKKDAAKWAEPGLAGVYLALRDHFSTTRSGEISRPPT